MPSRTSVPTWTSRRACPRKETEPPERSPASSPLGNHRTPPLTDTSQLKRKSGWLCHYQDFGRLPAASGGTTPFPIRLPLSGPICLMGLGSGLQMMRERWRSIRRTRRKL
nr:uncharacterized protein LOC118878569 isoform X1 [Drosophila suzukii]